MPTGPEHAPDGHAAAPPTDPIRDFVEHWGVMARSWGINPTMGELFALLFITGLDWPADDLRQHLRISRGNVSMNLRELLNWGVIHKVHRRGERREYYRAEADVWILFRRILTERKRRELEPTLRVLESTARSIRDDPSRAALHERVVGLMRFFRLIDALTRRLASLDPEDLEHLLLALDDRDESADAQAR